MTATIERARDALADHLEDGERVLAAVQAQLEGGTMRLASRVGLAVGTGAMGAAAVAMIPGDAAEVDARLANGLVLAVTDRRLVLLDVSAVSARPKEPVVGIDRALVTDVATGEKRVMLVKLPTIELTLDGEPDRVLRLEVPKVGRREAEAVVQALRS